MTSTPGNFSAPTEKIRKEFENFLENDVALYGFIYRAKRDNVSNEEIQKSRGAAYPNFIWNYQRYIRALLEGDLPSGISLMNEVAVLFRRVSKLTDLSEEAIAHLTRGLAEIEKRKNDPEIKSKSEKQLLKSSQALEKKSTPGIYVYTLMHYMNYRYDPDSDRTLIKVGKSDRDVIQRFREQIRTTALPEEPVLLRIYESKDQERSLSTLEKTFHEVLEAADHDRSTARTGGTEWFLTSLKFLDKIAFVLGMTITTNEDLDSDDSD
jgi:hypothetical protein